MIRHLLISAGTVSLALGIIGIFIPVLPTTPFVLLSAGLYVKSSPELYSRVVNGRITSVYLIPRAQKKAGIWAMAIMWIMILLTFFLWVSNIWLKTALITVGITGTIFKIKYFFGKRNKKTDRELAQLAAKGPVIKFPPAK